MCIRVSYCHCKFSNLGYSMSGSRQHYYKRLEVQFGNNFKIYYNTINKCTHHLWNEMSSSKYASLIYVPSARCETFTCSECRPLSLA